MRVNSPRLLDGALAIASAALALAAIFPGALVDAGSAVAGARWWVAPLLLLPSAALLLRRSYPLATVVGAWAPIALHALLTGRGAEGLFLVVPGWVSLFSLALYASRRHQILGVVVAVGSVIVHDVNDPGAWRSGAEAAWAAAFWNVVLFLPLLFGWATAGARRARVLAAEKASAEAHTLAAIAAERARIARELHDVITHHVNVVVLQAMAASGVLDREPERVREPLAVIERSGREALEEMRRLLGVLRDDREPRRELAPQPGVDDLDSLVATAREGGLAVGITVAGTPFPLPAGLALTVYRIVQEALTNAARYAARSRVAVTLRYEEQELDVAVADDGPGSTTPPAGGGDRSRARDGLPAGGHGLLGMRERVSVFGGTLEAGPRGEGGFLVHARLPVHPELA